MPSILNTTTAYYYGSNYTISTYFELKAEITQNISNNTSSLAYTLTTKQTPTSDGYQRSINSCSVNINGTTSTTVLASKVYNGVVLQTGTVTVTHNTDGTKTIPISVSVNVGGTVVSGSANYTLNQIPRASEITLASDTIVINSSNEGSGTVSYTITPKANYYHKLEVIFGNGVYTQTIGQKSSSYTSTVTYTNILSAITTAKTGTVVFRLSTYSDSGYTTLIGTNSANLQVTITLIPSISIGTLTADNSAMTTPIANTYFVSGYSKVNIPYTATNTTGSTGVTVYATITQGTLVESSKTGLTGTFVSNILPASQTNTQLVVRLTATDSRGAQSEPTTKGISTVYGYQPPVLSLVAYRVATDTSTTEDFAGAWAYIAYDSTLGVSIDGKNSIKTRVCTYDGSISGTVSTYPNPAHFALGDGQYITVTFTSTDNMGSATTTMDIPVVAMPLDLYQEGTDVGAAFGGEARPNALTNYMATNNIIPYATCTTTNTTQAKVATTLGGDFQLKAGAVVIIKFTNGQTYNGAATLNVDGTGAHTICGYGSTTTSRYYWGPGAVRTFVFDGTNYVLEHGYYATTTYYGPTKLVNSTTSTSNAYAATPNSVKTAYDAATKSTATADVITRTSGATLDSSSAIKQGKVVSVTLSVTGSGTLNSGDNLFEGTLASDFYPPNLVSSTTYYGANIVIGVINASGNVVLRWITTNGTSGGVGTSFNFTWTFVQTT